MPVALSAAIQCLFHDAISFTMTLSAAIQHLFPYANSFAMPVALSVAMERSVRFHSLCLLPSRRQSLCGFHNAASFALPVAFSAALQRWSHNAIIGYACCLFCGNSCLSHDAISFARTRSASIQRLLPLSAAVQRLLLYAIFTRHACCPLGSIGALDATFIRCSLGENPVRVCGSLFFVHRFARPFMPDFSRHSAPCWDPSQPGPYLAFLIRV